MKIDREEDTWFYLRFVYDCKKKIALKCNHIAIRNSITYIDFPFVELGSKNGKSVCQ